MLYIILRTEANARADGTVASLPDYWSGPGVCLVTVGRVGQRAEERHNRIHVCVREGRIVARPAIVGDSVDINLPAVPNGHILEPHAGFIPSHRVRRTCSIESHDIA